MRSAPTPARTNPRLPPKLNTLVVPGSGLNDDVLYPKSNRGFAKKILKAGGGFLSEYAPDETSHIHFFPERNRIVVERLTRKCSSSEAGQKSGTLITARLAGEYNRDLLCIPHLYQSDPHAFGSHLFIRLGAALVSDQLRILEALHIVPREGAAGKVAASDLEDAELVVWNMLEEPRTVRFFARKRDSRRRDPYRARCA